MSSFSINSGAESTTSTSVTLNNSVTGSTATHYMASETADFAGAAWLAWSGAPSFTLSSAPGAKTVYFKVKDASGVESETASDGIELTAAALFAINNGDPSTTSRDVSLNCALPGIAPSHFMASESSTFKKAKWKVYAQGPSFRLSKQFGDKTIYFKVKDSSGKESEVFSDSISFVEPTPMIESFAINNNAASTTKTKITLKSAVKGSKPTHYMASESADFAGAGWLKYRKSCKFSTGTGLGVKTMYFKVKNKSGIESEVVSDSIELLEPPARKR